MMMTPPMVGTPFFWVLYGSVASSRWVSMILLRFSNLMNQLPNQTEIIKAKMMAAAARKVT